MVAEHQGHPSALLFLVADTGGGHRASADAVARQLIATAGMGRFLVHVIDPFEQTASWPLNRASALYGPLIRHAPWLWGAVYHATNTRAAVLALRATVLRSVRPGLAGLINAIRPATVVSFHPLLNHVAARVCRATSPPVPLLTVITDLYDVHASWMCREVDAVVTPTPSALDQCRRAGIPAGRCHDLGLPVDPSFAIASGGDGERAARRERLGVAVAPFTVLLVGGGDGTGGLEERTRALATAAVDVQIVVICGHNDPLRRRLAGLRDLRGRPVVVLGFVANMAEWMRATDLVITKAGPGTIAESLCCGVPLLLTWNIPGQERGNIAFVVATGTGRHVPHVGQMVDTVAELCAPGSAALAAMRRAVGNAARPDATARIADLIVATATGMRPATP